MSNNESDWLDHWIRPKDVPTVTKGAVSERQARRWIAERRVEFSKPTGKSGPVYIKLSGLRELLASHVTPASR